MKKIPEKVKETGTAEVTDCDVEYARGYLYCLINILVIDDNLYDEYARAIDDIGT